jgi:hypothetical protein
LTFDQIVLGWCVAVPALLAAAVGVLATLLAKRLEIGRWQSSLVAGCLGFGWWAAVVVGIVGRREGQWWPDEFWQFSLLGALLAAVLLSGGVSNQASSGTPCREGFGGWTLVGLLAIVTAWLALPAGEGWEDMLPLHRHWMAAVAVSGLLTAWAVERLARADAEPWLLWGVVAGLAGPFALAAATYGALAEAALAAVSATVTFAILALVPKFRGCWVVAFPAVFCIAPLTAASRFYSYEDRPWWLYAVACTIPTIVSLVDLPLRRRPRWVRVGVAALVAGGLVGICIWQGLGVGQEESW